jgi:hypothetical protein
MKHPSILALFAMITALAASAQQAGTSVAQPCDNCGVVVSIAMSQEEESWAPLGVVSAVPSTAGSMQARPMMAFGGDAKREVVMIGAAGGAVYARRPNQYQKSRWNVTVKMDAGGQRVIQQRYEPFVREGDRVRIHGTQIELADS